MREFGVGVFVGALIVAILWAVQYAHKECELKGGVRLSGQCVKVEVIK
jgi:hypothetical protein